MLIVVAVLAIVAAFSWPAMQRLSRRSRVADAAAVVRAELGRARLEAIELGTPRQFRFQPGGRRFEIARRSARIGGDLELFGQFGAVDASEPRQPPTAGTSDGEITVAELDEGVYFWVGELGEPLTADAAAAGLLGQENWSAPIVFYPNGRTLNAHFLVTDGRDYYVEVTLRGLTGAASTSPVQLWPKEREEYSLQSTAY